ncbi:SDR family NAD(P)-dependent oxidoreductase [Shigella flexneri]
MTVGARGYTVAVNYQQNLHAAQEDGELNHASRWQGIVLQADISDEKQVVEMFTAIDQHDEPLAALVNNAGILFTQCTVENLTAERIDRVLSTNVTGHFLCCREAVKRMALKNGGNGGAIVNVSSVASRLGSPGEYVDYAASKGAIDTLTTGLSLEVAAQGIRVNGVRPVFYTGMHASGGEPGRVDRVSRTSPCSAVGRRKRSRRPSSGC